MSFLDELSRKQDVPYRFAAVPEGRRSYLIGGVVVLDESLTPERAHWAYCHEVAHLKLNHPRTPPMDSADEVFQENEANRMASEMLLPEREFSTQVHRTLPELKELFPHASYEVIARRRLAFRPGLLSIVDNGKLTARVAPDGWNKPAQLFPLEKKAYDACMKKKGEVTLNEEGMQVEATYVDEGRGVVRVILFLEGE